MGSVVTKVGGRRGRRGAGRLGGSFELVELVLGWIGGSTRKLRSPVRAGVGSLLPPAMAPYPRAFSFSNCVFNKPRGHAETGSLVSGSWKLTKKKGTLFSQGIRRKVLRSGTAMISWYPFSLLLILSSRMYVLSCMSQPKMTEQKPKPLEAMERNFFLETSFPRKIPSTSMPASLTELSLARRSGRSSTVSFLASGFEPSGAMAKDPGLADKLKNGWVLRWV